MASAFRPSRAWCAKRGIGRGAAVHFAKGCARSFGGREVLRGLGLGIAAGEFVAIVGRSGCGKSTLLRLLAGLDRASEGDVTIGGEPVSGRVAEARLMFQDARLLPWRRVLDNVGIGVPDNWRMKAYDALASVGLQDRADDWPAIAFPAASVNASRLPGRWYRGRNCCCSMSRSARSTP